MSPEYDDTEADSVELTLDDGRVVECEVLTVLEVDGRTYMALFPPEDEPGTEEGDIWLYCYSEDSDGNISLAEIEDEEEFEMAEDAFDEWLDDMEFEEIE